MSKVGSSTSAQLDLPLPEITEENFSRAWTRFELVASAKDWDATKQAVIVPTLLKGRLVDMYVDLSDDIKADIKKMKESLLEKAGLVQDPLTSWKAIHIPLPMSRRKS